VSIQDAVEFLVRVSDDPDLFESIASLNGEAMVHRARKMGLSFTNDELTAVVASSDLDPAYAGQALSESELDRVSGGGIDPMAFVQQALRQSYMETVDDLRNYADKVKSFNSTKRAIRRSIGALR
jgi:predicted ribosomally synthesized peptide with nif11-like leader